MQLPFTPDEFFGLFRAYNESIGPAPVALSLLALGLAALAWSSLPWRHRAVAAGLSLLWLWSGVVYHWAFFSRINPAARLFGAAFVLQAALLAAYAIKARLRFTPHRSGTTAAGWALVVYALLVYPVIGWASGHAYPAGPSFGAPCPTLILFFGLMMWALDDLPAGVLVVPVLWAIVGTSAALQLGIHEDLGLPVAALVIIVAMIRERRGRRSAVTSGLASPLNPHGRAVPH